MKDFIIVISNLLIEHIYPLMTIIFPIAIAIITFFYQEAKDLAYNATYSIRRLGTGLLFFLFLLNVVLYAGIIINFEKSKLGKTMEFHTESPVLTDHMLGLLVISLFVLFVISAIFEYRKLFNSINIEKVCKDRIESVEKKIVSIGDLSKPKKVEKYLKDIDNDLHVIGQILMTQLNYNLAPEFSRTLREFFQLQKEIFRTVDSSNPGYLIMQKQYVRWQSMYDDILDINLMLLEKAITNKKREATNMLMKQSVELFPGDYDDAELQEKTLILYYKNIIFSYETITANYPFDMNDVFLELISKSTDTGKSMNTSYVFTLCYAMLMQSVLKNDIKMVATFVNYLFILMKNERARKGNRDDFKYDKTLGEILILASVKSLELGHSKCAGYLIKVAVNHQKDILLNRNINDFKEILDKFQKPTSESDSELFDGKNINQRLLDKLNFEIYLMDHSFEYCYFKMIMLIVKQQEFLVGLNIFDRSMIYEIDQYTPPDEMIFNKAYMENKISGKDEQYGLQSLKKEGVLERGAALLNSIFN